MAFPFEDEFDPDRAGSGSTDRDEHNPIPDMFEPPVFSADVNNEEAEVSTDNVEPDGQQSMFSKDEESDIDIPDGEYHFIRPEERAYSDAGYVSSDSASAVPHRYRSAPYSGPAHKPDVRRKKRGISTAAVVALCLVCAILGGLAGGGLLGLINGKTEPATESGSGTVINMATPGSSSVSTNLVSSGKELSAGDVYSLACRQAVAITTEITYTNIFGYTSSGAVSGSGFIISSNGYILTNYHVIEDASKGGYEISVLLYDGTEYTASIVGYEEDNDVAVLKIDADGLDSVTIGDSDGMQVGDTVYAVGNPLGELSYTMTSGMVSALDREITTSSSANGTATTINMFQFDAAVNSGNSGGPVYNSRGEVIGIVTAKYSDTGVEGLGFAVPVNDAISIANELITNGYVSGKAYMGITPQDVSSTVAQYYNTVVGVFVYNIEEGSCAEECGLNVRDIIVKLDDAEISCTQDLIDAKKNYHAGDQATLTVFRNGEYISLLITFDEERPVEEDEADGAVTQEQPSQGYTYQYPSNSSPYGQPGGWQQNP